MKKRCALLLAFFTLACTISLFPNYPSVNPPVVLEVTLPTLTDDSPSMAPTVPPFTKTPEPPLMPTSLQQPEILSIRHVQMIDAHIGWGEGSMKSTDQSSYHLLRTTDGGETWQDVTPPTRFSSPPFKVDHTVFAIDADTAWAISPDYLFSEKPPYVLVWRTTDGGKSWKASNPLDIADSFLRLGVGPRPQFFDAQHGWLTLRFEHRINAYSLEYRTRDGGVTWEQMGACSEADGPGPGCVTPLFSDAQTGWLSLPNYGQVDPATVWRVQRSQDGGQTWQTITLPHSQEERECYQGPAHVATGIAGILVSCTTQTGDEEDYYYLSADQGQTWQIVRLPGVFSLTSRFFFLDMAVGWWISEAANGYQLQRTTDGGATWQKQIDGLPWDWQDEYQFVDANAGWVVSYNDFKSGMELHRTVDGGKTWVKLDPQLLPADSGGSVIARMEPGDALVFRSIQMIDSLNGWAVGGNEYVFHTTDGGRTWQDVTPRVGSITAGRQFLALDAEHAWATVAGEAGVWSTEDGGKTWQSANASSIDDFTLFGAKTGFRAEPVAEHTLEELLNGSAALTISKTIDGGSTWQPINLPPLIADIDKIRVDRKVYPGGIHELMQNKPACGITVQMFSADTIGLRATCRMYRLVDNTYTYVFLLNNYYLSTDSGISWNHWLSKGGIFPWQEEDTPVESEFFLPGGTGWRLEANQLLQTVDGGKTWTAVKAVGWEAARFHFINPQEGWGIVKSGKSISLVHTLDGGKTWEEIKPVIAP